MGGTAGLAHAWAGFQKRDFAACQAAVMDELLAQGATRPAAAEKRLVAVEPFLADLAVPGLNPQQHRLPVPTALSDTHAAEYSEGERREARGEGRGAWRKECGAPDLPIQLTVSGAPSPLTLGLAPVIDSTAPIERALPLISASDYSWCALGERRINHGCRPLLV